MIKSGKKERILMMGNDNSVKGGITSVILQILNHKWKEENIKLEFLPTYGGGGTIKKVLFFGVAYINLLFRLIFHRPNKVYVHMSYKGSFDRKYLLFKLINIWKLQYYVHMHGSEFEKFYLDSNDRKKKKIAYFLENVTGVIVLGKEWERVIKKIAPRSNICVISNTVSVKKCTCSRTPNKPVTFLFMGVLIKRKGVKDLLKAVYHLKNMYSNEQLKVIIAGDGEEFHNLVSYADKLGIMDMVDFVGWVDKDKTENLCLNSQVFILPSYNEGLPMAILEAMSFGLPILASNVGDVASAVHDGKNGFLFKTGDVNGIANVMSFMIENPKIWNEMSETSVRLIQENFNEKEYFRTLSKFMC